MSQISSPCDFCRHLKAGSATCAAFPEGIPADLLHYRADHRQPFAGDRGIRFEPDDGVDDEMVRLIGNMLDRFVKPAAASVA